MTVRPLHAHLKSKAHGCGLDKIGVGFGYTKRGRDDDLFTVVPPLGDGRLGSPCMHFVIAADDIAQYNHPESAELRTSSL